MLPAIRKGLAGATPTQSTALRRSRSANSRKAHSKTDPQTQELADAWKALRLSFFPDRPDIDEYTLRWSRRRQKRTLASCNIRRRIVTVAKEMQHENVREWLEPLLYHEMCHAFLGDSIKSFYSKTPWHGKEFRRLEMQHPDTLRLQNWIRTGGWLKAVRSARARVTFSKLRQRHNR